MHRWTSGRLGAAAGVGFIVLTVIGDALAGSMPSTDDSGAKIASFFEDHRHAVIAGAVLTGIAAPLFLAFASAMALRLRAAGPGLAPAVFFGSALVGVALGVVADALYGGMARIGPQGDNELARVLYVVDGFVTAKSFWFATAAILAAAWGGRRLLAQWYGVLSLGTAIIVAIGGLSLRSNGLLRAPERHERPRVPRTADLGGGDLRDPLARADGGRDAGLGTRAGRDRALGARERAPDERRGDAVAA